MRCPHKQHEIRGLRIETWDTRCGGGFRLLAMRYFSARETEWIQELDGIELASFWQRFSMFR